MLGDGVVLDLWTRIFLCRCTYYLVRIISGFLSFCMCCSVWPVFVVLFHIRPYVGFRSLVVLFFHELGILICLPVVCTSNNCVCYESVWTPGVLSLSLSRKNAVLV